MRPFEGLSRSGGGSAHPAALLALSIGIAIGAFLSSPSARSAERASPGADTAIGVGALGEPKRVTTTAIPAPSQGAPAKSSSRYDGDTQYRRCIDTSDGTNVAWDLCGTALVAREDAKLNAAWNQVYASGAPAHGPDLLNEQRAWNTFKESSCRFYASGSFGREGQVLSYPVCRAGVIAARTAALLAYGEDTAPK